MGPPHEGWYERKVTECLESIAKSLAHELPKISGALAKIEIQMVAENKTLTAIATELPKLTAGVNAIADALTTPPRVPTTMKVHVGAPVPE